MIPGLVFVLSVILGAALAVADGALLAFHTAASPDDVDASKARQERQHRALAIARVIVYLTMGTSLAQTVESTAMAPELSLPLQVVAAIIVVAITEGAGRALAHAPAVAASAALRTLTSFVARTLAPVVAVGAGIERLLDLVLPPIPPDDEDREATAEQFREVVAAEAEISVDEEALLDGVFTMARTEVHEIMVPRVDILAIERSIPWSEVLDRVRSSEHARLPVFRETVDDIVGILYAKDLLADAVCADAMRDGDFAGDGWHRLVRQAPFIPVSKPIDVQLREFQASHTHMAIVTDEYGGTAGLITIEDILEEIVGEIRDEYDDVEEPDVEQEGPDKYWVSGRVSIDDLSDRLGSSFAIDGVSTVGGLVYSLFGRVPRAGDAVTNAGFRIVVERVRRRRIERVYFERVEYAMARKAE